MAIREDILALKNKEGTLTNNKVCNFSYDDTAFEDDTTVGANGVSVYNYNNHNNIPVKDPEILKVNPTIISKGFRSQVSTLPRMLLNHIFGRVSYNLNKTVDTLNSLLTNLYNYIGQPNGLATLDNTGRLPYSQLPLSAVEYKGTWNANTNTPALASGTGTFGDEYIVSVQGTQNIGEGSILYHVGDRVIYNGSIWQRIPVSSLRTVNSKSPDANGNVTVYASDMTTPDVYGYDRRNIGRAWYASATTGSFRSVYFDDNIWVAGGTNGLYWATDGRNWTQGLSGVTIVKVKYGNGIWVAVASHAIYWSTDGKNWTAGLSGVRATFTDMDFGNNVWIATARVDESNPNYDGGTWRSTDGKNWSNSNSRALADVCKFVKNAGSSGYFYVCMQLYGYDRDVYYSTNGSSWSRTQSSYIKGREFNDFESDGSVEIWCSNASGLYRNRLQIAGTSGGYRKVLYADAMWVAGGDWSKGLWWSDDSTNWTQGLSGVSVIDIFFDSVEHIWVACGNDGLWWSLDGKNWTACTGDVAGARNIYYANNIFVSAGSWGLGFSVGSLTNNVATILDWLLYAVNNMLP